MKIKISILIIFFIGFSIIAFSQSESNIDGNILLRRERSVSINIHSAGWGFGYRSGKFINGFKKRMTEIEFVTMKHPKEIKTTNPYYENSRSYFYGKLNNLYIGRFSYGIQKVINNKPYWGGAEVRFFYYGGASLGFVKPVYLYIINESSSDNEILLTVEKYNPDKHQIQDIYGKGPFGKGIDKMKLYAGVFAKIGLNFEYGDWNKSIKALEAGIILDYYPKAIPIMAYNDDINLFLSFYISFNFGKRFN